MRQTAGDGRGRNYAGVEISICREGLGLVFVRLSRNLRKQDVGGKEHRQQNDDHALRYLAADLGPHDDARRHQQVETPGRHA